MKRLVFIDGHAQIFRAIFAPLPTPLTAPDGTPTSGVYVFLQWLHKAVNRLLPDYLAVAVDSKREDLERRRIYPEYKANRPTLDPTIGDQLKIILKLMKKLELPLVSMPGWEADDVLATLASRYAREEDRDITIVGRDKDLHQILKTGISLYDPQTDEFTFAKDAEKRWGVPCSQVIDVQALAGDSGDNVPGAKGIGLKKATALVQEYGSVDAVVRNKAKLTPGLQKSLTDYDHVLMRSLVTLRTDLPLAVKLKQLRWQGLDFSKIRSDLRSLGIKAIK